MIEMIYLAALLFAAVVSLANWRWGMLLIVVFDLIRDPVRKLSSGQSVVYSLVMNALWLTTFLGAFTSVGNRMMSIQKKLPSFRQAFQFLIAALIPGVLISTILYPGGWQLAAIGSAAYLAPFLGILLGYVFIRNENDLWKLFSLYCILNTIAFSSAFIEYSGVEHVVLGGINMDWIRYRTGYTVKLITGIYRSPDILGLHAAHTIFFSLMLLFRQSKKQTMLIWIACILIATAALILCGRRKMIALPIIYIVTYFSMLYFMGTLKINKLLSMIFPVIVAATILFLVGSEGLIGQEHTEYAGTTTGESGARIRSAFINSPLETLRQSGIIGSGMGTATQGGHYINIRTQGGWQEDGIGRLFAEFGVVGLILLTISFLYLIATFHTCIKNAPRLNNLSNLLAGLVAILISNMASFIISHQAYSSDPTIVLFLGFFAGIIFSVPSKTQPPAKLNPDHSSL